MWVPSSGVPLSGGSRFGKGPPFHGGPLSWAFHGFLGWGEGGSPFVGSWDSGCVCGGLSWWAHFRGDPHSVNLNQFNTLSLASIMSLMCRIDELSLGIHVPKP